jgi:hypothetical protein
MSADNIPNGAETNGGINTQYVTVIKDETSTLPEKHFTLSVNFLPIYCLFPQQMRHWSHLNGDRRNNKWFIWPDCTVGTVKIIFSCFLVNVAPGNMALELKENYRKDKGSGAYVFDTVPLEDDNQMMEEILKPGKENRCMNLDVWKKRELNLWDSYKNVGPPFKPKPKIDDQYLEVAPFLVEDHWMEFVSQHSGLLTRFFDYNETIFENWDMKYLYAPMCVRKTTKFMYAVYIFMEELQNRRQRFEEFQAEVRDRLEEDKVNPDEVAEREEQYVIINNLYFHGNPRGC